MMGPHAEESPFGSMMTHNIDDDEAQDLAGGMVTADNTINVLDSPFASSYIHDDLGAAAKSTDGKVNVDKSTQPINGVEKSGSSTSTMGSQTASSFKSSADGSNNGSVVNILESPFSITQLETMKLEGHLSDASAVEALTSATAAVNLDSSKKA